MVLREHQMRLKSLLREAITFLCKNELQFQNQFEIEALIGITLDEQDVLLVSINQNVHIETHMLQSKTAGQTSRAHTIHEEIDHSCEPSNKPVHGQSDALLRKVESWGSSIHQNNLIDGLPNQREAPSNTSDSDSTKQTDASVDKHPSSPLGSPPKKKKASKERSHVPWPSTPEKSLPLLGTIKVEEDLPDGSSFVVTVHDNEQTDEDHRILSDEKSSHGTPKSEGVADTDEDMMDGIIIKEEEMSDSELEILQSAYSLGQSAIDEPSTAAQEPQPGCSSWADSSETAQSEGRSLIVAGGDPSSKKESSYTEQGTKTAVRMFQRFLKSEKRDVNFEKYSKQELNESLCKFFLNLRKEDGTPYKLQSLTSVRFGLARKIQELRDVDIRRDPEFRDFQKVVKSVEKMMKEAGLGAREIPAGISAADMAKLYSEESKLSVFDINTPVGLQNKVWFELVFFCGKRVKRHDILHMNQSSLVVGTCEDGKEYVTLSEDMARTGQTGVMYSMPGSYWCPVTSVKKYLGKIDKSQPRLWQQPRRQRKLCAENWYSPQPVGRNSLFSMMPNISKSLKLSHVYTNHSVNVTDKSLYEHLHGIRPLWAYPYSTPGFIPYQQNSTFT